MLFLDVKVCCPEAQPRDVCVQPAQAWCPAVYPRKPYNFPSLSQQLLLQDQPCCSQSNSWNPSA